MPRYHVKGWIQITIPVDEYVIAENELDAKCQISNEADGYVSNSALTAEMVFDEFKE